MKKAFSAFVIVFVLTSGKSAFAEYTCMATFVKKSDEYDKGYRTTIYDYYYKDGYLLYSIPKTGYVDAKLIKLDKDCVLQKLERRIELETVR